MLTSCENDYKGFSKYRIGIIQMMVKDCKSKRNKKYKKLKLQGKLWKKL